MSANATRFHCTIPAFPSELRVYAVNGEETLSNCFHYDVELVVPNDKPQPVTADLIDQPVLLQFDTRHDASLLAMVVGSASSRLVHGIIEWMEVLHEDMRHTHYRLRVVPQLWRLTQRSDSRIFQFKTVQAIVEEVLKEAGFAGDDFQFILQEEHAEREYCVQYRETDLNFIMRLLAEEGVFFYFTHEEARHCVVFSDTVALSNDLPGDIQVAYKPPGGGVAQDEHISSFHWRDQVRSGKFTHTDYKFQNPALELEKGFEVETFTHLAQYDYHGRYVEPGRGDNLARFRLEQMRVDQQMGFGVSDSVRFQVGRQFELTAYDQRACNRKYTITGIRVALMQPQVKDELSGGGTSNYHCEFTCIPDSTPCRSAYVPDKPQIYGPQTAIVVGPAGEEIYVDEHGRVKVQFHWDRYGDSDEHSSCWVRVSQGSAGPAYGAMFIPRIGHEVIVDYLEGDIDRPIITGRVYHGTNVPPYPLPENKTRSSIRTQSHKGEGYNEIRFEDESGQEELFIHAQKDENIKVLNDKTETVGSNETISIGADRTLSVTGNQTSSTKGTHLMTAPKIQEIGTEEIVLQVGGSLIKMLPEQILIESNGSQIILDEKGIREFAPLIILNDKK